MNYLAHLFLAQPSADSYFGNLLGDFRRGIDTTGLPDAVQAALRNHLLVDKYTDSHPAVIHAKRLVSKQRRRFAGILLDICFDHFLLHHWYNYTDITVDAFSHDVYQGLGARYDLMPPVMQPMIASMLKHRWLSSYADLRQLHLILERTANRIRFQHQFHNSIEEIERYYDEFEAAFLSFFPDLIAHVKARNIEKQPV